MRDPDESLLARLTAEVETLRKENERLRLESEGVATANVNAALQLLEIGEARQRELEAKNRDIAAALAAAEESSRQKTRFLANMSHELRTPLSGILGMTELLLSASLGEEHREYVRAIASTADSFLELVNQLLDISKIEAGRIELERIEFDFWEVVEAVAQLLQVRCDSKALEFEFFLAPDVPRFVTGDPLRVRQILVNLAGNAVKFTSQGSVRLEVLAGPAQGRVQVRVTDTGCGIPDEVGARIFEPFVQADASTTRRFGGTGLGLAICRNLVHLMRGEIRYSSRQGAGTSFELELPFAATARAMERFEPTRCGRASVAVTRQSLERMLVAHLAAAGWQVVGADRRDLGAHDLVVVDREHLADAVTFLGTMPHGRPRVLELVSRASEAHASESTSDPVDAVLPLPVRPTRLLHALAGPAATGSHLEPTASFAGLRVLVAEDTPVNRRVVVAQLEKLGCVVTAVPDGESAVQAARSGPFDVIFMDCQMPGLDGYDATGAIRAFEEKHGTHTAIVALTANALAGDREACLSAGMDDYLSKPVRQRELADALRRWAPPLC